MPCSLITPDNLRAGIVKFSNKKKWRRDFHNRFYARVTAAAHAHGSIMIPGVGAYSAQARTLWEDIVNELAFWKALRPLSKTSFLSNPKLATLSSLFQTLHSKKGALKFNLSSPDSEISDDLFLAAQEMKPTKKPAFVFASKCCHMLVPWEYPIWDRTFVGDSSRVKKRMLASLNDWPELDSKHVTYLRGGLSSSVLDYSHYRKFVLLAWDTLSDQEKKKLQSILDSKIKRPGSQEPIWENFPYRTKIPELCIAGV